MGKESKIEWTHHTFNPWWGCARVSPGCAHCYAESLAHRYGHDLWGKGKARKPASEKMWSEPIKWNKAAGEAGERHRVFCASMSDVFDDEAPKASRERLWQLIEATPNLDWLLLTKRPENILGMLPADWGNGWANVWLGTTVENDDMAEKRIKILLRCPAVVRFLSVEPMIGPVNVFSNLTGELLHHSGDEYNPGLIDWVICGGESGHGARPMNPDWAVSLRDQCKTAGVPFLFKQWGEWHPVVFATEDGDIGITPAGQLDPEVKPKEEYDFGHGVFMERIGKKNAGRLLDGIEHNGYPAPQPLTVRHTSRMVYQEPK